MQILCPTCRLAFAAIARPVCLWPQTWHRVGKLRNMNSEHFWTASDKSILGYHTYVYILEKSSRKYHRIFYHRILFGFWPLRHAETVYHTVAAVMQSSCWKIRSQTKDSRFNATAFEFWVNKYKQVTNRLNRPASHSSIQRYEVVWMCETALWWWTLMFGDPGYWMILVDIGSSRQATFVDSNRHLHRWLQGPQESRGLRAPNWTHRWRQVSANSWSGAVWSDKRRKDLQLSTISNGCFYFALKRWHLTCYLRAENWRLGVSETVHESCKDMNTMHMQSCAYMHIVVVVYDCPGCRYLYKTIAMQQCRSM